MSPAVRQAMIRGWFTASLFGQLTLTDGSSSIFVPSESGGMGNECSFPNPMLSADSPQTHEFLPAVLTSILLALVEVNTQASLQPLKPYTRLRDLGRSGRGGEFDVYDVASGELEDWVLTGSTTPGAPPVLVSAGTPEDDWKTRRTIVEERFASLKERYADELFAPVQKRADVFDVPNAFELRTDILGAFDDLQRAVRHLEPRSQEAWN